MGKRLERFENLFDKSEGNRKFFSKKLVVYSCLSGNYDKIPFVPKDKDVDFIMFIDISKDKVPKDSNWEFRPIDTKVAKSHHFINRYYKFHPHVLFPEYECSIYLDSNIFIFKTGFLKKRNFELIKNNKLISIPKHPQRNCIYQECDAVNFYKKDDFENVERNRKFLLKENYPKNNGFFENGFIWRKHNDEKVVSTMKDTWELLNRKGFSQRDQLVLVYTAWKNKLNIEMFWEDGHCCRNDKNLKLVSHGKIYKSKLIKCREFLLYILLLPLYFKKSLKAKRRLLKKRLKYSCDIPKDINLKQISLPHPVGIVISKGCTLGKNLIIFQNVTVGAEMDIPGHVDHTRPVVKDNVIIFANAIVVGNITIGRNSIVAANSFISIDIPENSTAYGYNKFKKRLDR